MYSVLTRVLSKQSVLSTYSSTFSKYSLHPWPSHGSPPIHMYIWASSRWSTYTHVHLSQLIVVHLYTCTFESAHNDLPIHMSFESASDEPSIHMYIWASSRWSTYTHVHLSQLIVVHLYTCTFESAHNDLPIHMSFESASDEPSIHMYIWASSWCSSYKHVHLSQLIMIHLYTCAFGSSTDGPPIHVYIWVS